MARAQVKKIFYAGWKNCVQIRNDIADLVVTTEVGPRIIRYGFLGQVNELCEVGTETGLTGGDEWRIYGGHRLWHSPEDKKRTYEPDNSPIKWNEIEDGVHTVQETGRTTGIKKEMLITLSPDSSAVTIIHRLTNKGQMPVELSAWSISAMAAGGKEVIPQSGRDTGLLPNRVLSLWPYTRLTDPRICLGEQYIIIQQDAYIKHPLKIGTADENGWAAYFNHSHLFVKYYTHYINAGYPDLGVSYETYVNDFMLEMETLSPLTTLQPDSSVEHAEQWELFDNVPAPPDDESGIGRLLKGRVRL
ncbi:MAG: hypothetical protein C4526_11955 [Nitrospiraceae bacterium]|nr:MAG: hypothetical protein C4526_11955 [Nitrospiraceae bacterium]